MLNEYDDLLTVQEACEILLVSKNTIYNLITEKKIDAFRYGDNARSWKIKKNSLVNYIRKEAHLI